MQQYFSYSLNLMEYNFLCYNISYNLFKPILHKLNILINLRSLHIDYLANLCIEYINLYYH